MTKKLDFGAQAGIEKIFQAVSYSRLSREDGDKEESNSITGQKELIKEFVSGRTDIRLVKERWDDGYSGTNFDRPGFQQIMEDIKSGEANCVIVKDLSRFGRNYIEAGRYIEQIFPFLGVRFIAVNDHYDSLTGLNQSDSIIVPFKNLINDAYCRDISTKIRSQFNIKRKKGDFIGSFAPYGYQKSPENKNQLMIDQYPAKIVQDIFEWKLAGGSQQVIATRLNDMGIYPPTEYKKATGEAYYNPFQSNGKAAWTPATVGRILTNEVYTGNMVQGKYESPNFRIKQRVKKEERDWYRAENTHEPIISKEKFELVQRLLSIDARIAPNRQEVYLFSGFLFCGDCRHAMIRHATVSRGKKYVYYYCSQYKHDHLCSRHNISIDAVYNAVLLAIQAHIDHIVPIEHLLPFVEDMSSQDEAVYQLNFQIEQQTVELKKCYDYIRDLYDDYKKGIIGEDDFKDLKQSYSERSIELEKSIKALKDALEAQGKTPKSCNKWINMFQQYRNVTELSRQMLANLIEHILVYENGRINIRFRYQFNYEEAFAHIENTYQDRPNQGGS